MTPGQILIVSDDSEFVRFLVARWRMEKDSPVLTAVSSGVSRQASTSGYEIIVVGPLRGCTVIPAGPAVHHDSVVCAVGDEESLEMVRAVHSGWLLIPECPGWTKFLFSLAGAGFRGTAGGGPRRAGERTRDLQKQHWRFSEYLPGWR